MKINHPTAVPENFDRELSDKERIARELLRSPPPAVRDIIRDYRTGNPDSALSALTAMAMMRQPGCSFAEMKNEIETIIEDNYV